MGLVRFFQMQCKFIFSLTCCRHSVLNTVKELQLLKDVGRGEFHIATIQTKSDILAVSRPYCIGKN